MNKKRVITALIFSFMILGFFSSVQADTGAAEMPSAVVKEPLTNRFPIKLKQGEAGSITIIGANYFNNKTVLRYVVKGKDPYRQAYYLSITNDDGERFLPLNEPQMISKEQYIFKMDFPPLDRRQTLYVQTKVQLYEKELQVHFDESRRKDR